MSKQTRLLISFFALAIFVCGPAFGCQEQKSESSDKSAQTREPAKQDPHNSKKHTNALAKETSPYLLQHAHNPVNWHAWNEATLAKAKQEDKVIFLSIGYSSCHWCHVMERESFLDDEIAGFLNENFICVKVDREERPDVDSIYMEALQIMRRRGGWPLSMFMTPEGKPFFGGTYFPARDGDRGATTGFLTIINAIQTNWKTNRDRIEKDAALVTRLTKRSLEGRKPKQDGRIQAVWVKMCRDSLSSKFDPTYGGFRFDPANAQVPKFPEPSNLLFLADQVRRDPDNAAAKNMLVVTCERMMMGGIYDHLGGGFHRYSVDRFWAIPHFEKMLYDNGQLLSVYSELYELTGRPDFKSVVEGTVEWLKREMVADGGGFYSALDAESEGEEGKFYRWQLSEINATLEPEQFKLFADIYRLNEAPNFEGKYYAPQIRQTLIQTAKQLGLEFDELEARLKPIRKKLFDVRAKRPRPLTDDKVLASWNGMMIRGLADAGRVLKNEEYIAMATRAADFASEKLIQKDGRLWRTNTKGESKLNAYLDDYACMIDGLLALHRATGLKKWIELATKLQVKQDELFWDDVHGGYFFTSSDHEVLLARGKKPIDGAVPSGNSVSAMNLIYLAEQLQKPEYLDRARRTVVGASGILDEFSIAAPRMLMAVEKLTPQKEPND